MGNAPTDHFNGLVHGFIPILGNFAIFQPVADGFGHAGIRRLGHINAHQAVAFGRSTVFGGREALELLRLYEQFQSHFILMVVFRRYG